MTENISKLSRLAVAIGGFLMMMGTLFMIAIALTASNTVNITALANETYLLVFMLALLSIGILDIIAGIMLSRG